MNLEESKSTKQNQRNWLFDGIACASMFLGNYIYICVLHEPIARDANERALCTALVGVLSLAIGQFVARRIVDLKDHRQD